MSPGHYFDVDPAVPSRPGQVELALPDFRGPADRGPGCVLGRRGRPGHGGAAAGHPRVASGRGSAGSGMRLRAYRLHPGPPGPGRHRVGGRHQQPGARAHRPQRRRPGPARGAPGPPGGRPRSVRFTGIWSNPPVRVGKAALHELLSGWLSRLQPEGAAWLVVHRHLGADSLAAWLAGEGRRRDRVGSKRGYRILRVAPP